MRFRHYITIGSAPCDEDCAQVGEPNYATQAALECARYIKALREHYGQEPEGAVLKIKGFSHDFGLYYEVVCVYDAENASAVDYAFKAEAGLAEWPTSRPS